MMDLEYTFNIGEAVLWILCSSAVLTKAFHARGKCRRNFASLSAAFFLFGISDWIESHTGAWWTPWWLLVWKAVCLACLAFGFFKHYKIIKPQNQHPATSQPV